MASELQQSRMGEASKPGPKPSVSDEQIISLFQNSDDPALSTMEVTEALPLKRRSIYDRLDSLEEDGTLEKKKIGGRNTIWWLNEGRD